MRYRPTPQGITAVAVIAVLYLLMGVVEGLPSPGAECDFSGDCDMDERCMTIPYHQRGGNKARGICVPKNTN